MLIQDQQNMFIHDHVLHGKITVTRWIDREREREREFLGLNRIVWISVRLS